MLSPTAKQSNADPRQVSFQMMTYPLVYMLIFIIPTSIRIYQFSTGKTAPFVVGIFDKVRRSTLLVDRLLTSDLSCRDALLPKALRMRLSTVRLLTCCASLQNLTISRSTRKYLECMARVLTAEGNSMIKDSRRRIESGSFLVAVVNEERIGGGID
jgi:hypothetical protein